MISILYCKFARLTNIFLIFCKKIHEKYFILQFYALLKTEHARRREREIVYTQFMKIIHQNMHRKNSQFTGYTQSYPHYPQKMGKGAPPEQWKTSLPVQELCRRQKGDFDKAAEKNRRKEIAASRCINKSRFARNMHEWPKNR